MKEWKYNEGMKENEGKKEWKDERKDEEMKDGK